MKPNPDLVFFREPEVDPTKIPAIGLSTSSSGGYRGHKKSVPPEQLWCIIIEQDSDLKPIFVHDEGALRMRVGAMMSSTRFYGGSDVPAEHKFISAWQLIEGTWVQIQVNLDLSLKVTDKYVPDDEDDEKDEDD